MKPSNANPYGRPQPLSGSSRLQAFLLRRTVVSDVLQGVIFGGVLAFVTVRLVISPEVQAIHTTANGWSTTLACGRRGNGVLRRAACARDIAALNLPEEQVYWQTFVDSAGHTLNGQSRYVLHFPPGGLPPNAASWSLTIGDARRRMVDNPTHRYSVGGMSGVVPNADGSIDIDIQGTQPAVRLPNWLPTPAGDFMLWLRVYEPTGSILSGQYIVPPVVEIK
jgi:hypothetical protein